MNKTTTTSKTQQINEQSHGNWRLRGTLQYLTRTNGISNSASAWANDASVAYQYWQRRTLTRMMVKYTKRERERESERASERAVVQKQQSATLEKKN